MAVSLAKRYPPGDLVVDVGCGTGKVSIAASRVAERIYAIIGGRRRLPTHARAAATGAGNIEFFEDAVKSSHRHLDAAFVGGRVGS